MKLLFLALLLIFKDHLEVVCCQLTSKLQLLIELKTDLLKDLEKLEGTEIVSGRKAED